MKTNSDINLEITDCGLIDYTAALNLQLELVEKRITANICNTVLLAEHKPVITLGARKEENKIIADASLLRKKNIDVIQVRRGGGTTAHNPGQIVIYPIIDLTSINIDINEHIRTLEAVGIELLNSLDVSSSRKPDAPGLWIDNKKIAAIGVKVKKHVTYHGIAINISNDLSIFDMIVPCGMKNVKITSAEKQLSAKIPMQKVKTKLTEICKKHFADKAGLS